MTEPKGYGLCYDWICDDHGKFGCIKCATPEQIASMQPKPPVHTFWKRLFGERQ